MDRPADAARPECGAPPVPRRRGGAPCRRRVQRRRIRGPFRQRPSTPHRVIRVVCVINELDLGGAERLLVDQINHSRGVEFHVCLLSAARSVLASRLPAQVPVHDLGGASRWDPRPVARLRATLLDIWPAVVHAHLPRAGAAAALATRGTDRPLVYTEHSVWSAYSRVARP